MNDTGDLSPFFLKPRKQKNKVLFGVASYYGDKFEGRKTASGDIFNQQKMTAACNKLPLGTRIRVTNIRNGKTVEVVVNDRLHPKMKRIVDLTKSAAKKLGYVDHGLTKVKVEVIGKVKNKN
jgi:rare lipoprotein A